MNEHSIYEDIAARTGGDIYIGVVGPVRTGKSTFIKRFMETLVLPGIENAYIRERARDELPQSASGRTVMTAEPKFVPEEAARLTIDGAADVSVRLIDCVGYMVPGAAGQYEDGRERMVTTPWLEREVPLAEAAEIGTRRVIDEHSTIGVVVTTDGTIGDIPRGDFEEAETRVINELRAIGKPFVVVINSAKPGSAETEALRGELSEKHSVTCIAKNVQRMDAPDIAAILKSVLYEFPIRELGVFLPAWVDALPSGYPIKSGLLDAARRAAPGLKTIRDSDAALRDMAADENVSNAAIRGADLGRGTVTAELDVPRELFYGTLSAQSGFDVRDDGDLFSLLTELSDVKREYDRIDAALRDVRESGYGIVMPSREELRLEEPEIVRQGGRYGVKLKASAPSIHMLMANVETEVSPAVGGERSNEDVINFLLQEFEGDVSRIWESNMFGKSLYDIAGEGLNAKIKKMPEETRTKLRGTLQRIINEGSGGIICIIL
ncbi:MAG: stage IV sporulation protein A [Oscillospiraceae bacterium]|nr:stage IV sporulation protein A [Oscillospiraceae bacterium]